MCRGIGAFGITLKAVCEGTSRCHVLGGMCDVGSVFAPSRGRALDAQASTGVSGRQPLGRAMPSLIDGAPDSVAAHIRAASAVSPVASLVNIAAPGQVNGLIASMLRNPGATATRRREAMAASLEVSGKQDPYRKGWSERLPADSPFRVINLPLLHLLVKRFGYSDSGVLCDIARSMPISGEIAATGCSAPREKGALSTLEDWPNGD